MKLSVIVPVHNGDKYIIQTLNCLACQTLKDIEIIVLQDGCTDNTAAYVQQYITRHPDLNIKSVVFNTNKGSSHARNTGAALATGEYIHFMDADDIIDVDFYQKLYNAAQFADADVACCSIINERRPSQNIINEHHIVLTCAQDKIDHTHVDRYGYSPRYLIRRSYWKSSDFAFPENLKYCEDVAIIPKMVLAANRLVLVPGAFYIYKHRLNSLLTDRSVSKQKMRRKDFHAATDVRNRLYCEYGLRASQPAVDEFKYKLFGLIPLFRTTYNHELMRKKFYLFGILIYTQYGNQN